MSSPVNVNSSAGPVNFGPTPTSSGTGTVIFGSQNPTATLAVSSLLGNPWLLAGLSIAGLVALYIWKKRA